MMAGLRVCAAIAEWPERQGALEKIARSVGAVRLHDDPLEEALTTPSHTTHRPAGTPSMGTSAISATTDAWGC
jgi:hypothetical protein